MQAIWRAVTRKWNDLGPAERVWLKKNLSDLPEDRDMTSEEQGFVKKGGAPSDEG